MSLDALAPNLLAGWDLARGIDTQIITDIGPQACAGRLLTRRRALWLARVGSARSTAGVTRRTTMAQSISMTMT